MGSQIEKTKSYQLNGSLDKIQKILFDLEYYGRLHPLIKKVELISKKHDLVQWYKIVEKPYPKIPIKIRYKALVAQTPFHEVVYMIEGIPFTKASIKYTLKQLDQNKVDITFDLKIKNYLIGKKILAKKMIAAQDELMIAMQKELDDMD